mmetsp:Transcript_1846/g.4158  ORF Transcript_1846/g.4158 Transcript_1846/m.4158 type:complete len:228 (-) Transcript_1846:1237-1920(-)
MRAGSGSLRCFSCSARCRSLMSVAFTVFCTSAIFRSHSSCSQRARASLCCWLSSSMRALAVATSKDDSVAGLVEAVTKDCALVASPSHSCWSCAICWSLICSCCCSRRISLSLSSRSCDSSTLPVCCCRCSNSSMVLCDALITASLSSSSSINLEICALASRNAFSFSSSDWRFSCSICSACSLQDCIRNSMDCNWSFTPPDCCSRDLSASCNLRFSSSTSVWCTSN